MKKNVLALTMVVLMVLTLFTGCGAQSKDMASSQMAYPEMYAPDMENGSGIYDSVGNSASNTTTGTASDQKLIKRVNMSVETENLDLLLEQIGAQVNQLGGYLEQQQLYNGSSYSSSRSRSANLTIRIPANRLDEFVQQVKGVSNVVRHNQSTENVTLSYVATESRMKALQTEETRLLELLSKAENMSDLLEIESRLTDVRYELECTTSQLRVMQNQVDYATVNLDIDQVREYTEVEPQTVWQRISGGFVGNLKELRENLVDLAVWLITYSPQLIILVIIIAIIRGSIKRRRNKKRAAAIQKPENQNP